MVKLRKCCRCRSVYPEDEAIKKPHKKFEGCTEDVCPKCGASSYYLHHAGEKKTPKPEQYHACPWPLTAAIPSNPLDLGHFTAWMNLCSSNTDLIAQFDRLRGTNVSRAGSPITVMIDESTGRFAEDARAFFDFCLDLYLRLPPP